MRPILLAVLRHEQTRSWLMDRFDHALDEDEQDVAARALVWELNEVPNARVSSECVSSVLLCHGRLGRHLLGTIHSTSLARPEMPRNPGVILLSHRFAIDMDHPTEVIQMLRFADKTYLVSVLLFEQAVGLRSAEYILLDSHRHADVPNKVIQRSVIITLGSRLGEEHIADPRHEPQAQTLSRPVSSWSEARSRFLALPRGPSNTRVVWRVFEPGSGSVLREVGLTRHFTIRDRCTPAEMQLVPSRFQPKPRTSSQLHATDGPFNPLSSQYANQSTHRPASRYTAPAGFQQQSSASVRQSYPPGPRAGVNVSAIQSQIFNLRDRPLSSRTHAPAHTESDIRLMATVKDLCTPKSPAAVSAGYSRSSPITSPDRQEVIEDSVAEVHISDPNGTRASPSPSDTARRGASQGSADSRFFCPTCNAGFAAKSNMNRHIRMVHEKLKPFRCDRCGVGFVQGSGLRRHRQRFHGASSTGAEDSPEPSDNRQGVGEP